LKYVVLVGDGMADLPVKELGGKTPLEAADIPNMNFIARKGLAGIVNTIPAGFTPGSDVAAMSIFGYDPAKYYTGRGPLEAANVGVNLKKDDVAFRCNLVTIENGKMKDFTAGHITDKEAEKIIRSVDKALGEKGIKFYPGVSYRHLAVINKGPDKAHCTPPHDITGKGIKKYLPRGAGAKLLLDLMNGSVPLLEKHKVNRERLAKGKSPANMIWLWGQGRAPLLPSFKKKYGLSGSVITAVNLIKGLGRLIGLEAINVPGATGYFDTNYLGKAKYALKSLEKNDFVLVHLEPPDEAGHMGNLKEKMRAIENFDRLVVGTILRGLKKFKDYRVLVLPDHPTPVSLMTHSNKPVPFAMFGTGIVAGNIKAFNEKAVSKAKVRINKGHELLDSFFKK